MISVVITTFNRHEATVNAIASAEEALMSMAKIGAEIIVVDDCSDSDIKEKNQIYIEANTSRELVKYHYLKKNIGAAGAKNKGVSYASNKWVLFLDSDDLFAAAAGEKIIALIEFGEKNGVDAFLARSVDNLTANLNGATLEPHLISMAEIVNRPNYGECMLLARREVLIAWPFNAFLRGSEGLVYIKMISEGVKLFLSDVILRRYTTVGSRLSDRKGQFFRSFELLISQLIVLGYIKYMNVPTFFDTVSKLIGYAVLTAFSLPVKSFDRVRGSIHRPIKNSRLNNDAIVFGLGGVYEQKNKSFLPLISVIINVSDCEEFLEQAITSAVNQTYKNKEIIIYLNASNKKTRDIASKYEGRLKIYRSDKFLTLPQARAAAIQLSRGVYIAFLDCDDLWVADKLSRQIDFLYDNIKAGYEPSIIFTDTIRIKNGKNVSNDIFWPKRSRDEQVQALLESNPIVFSSILLSRKHFILVGGFDQSLVNSIDYDLYLKLSQISDIMLLPEKLTAYRIHNSNLSKIQSRKVNLENISILQRYQSYPSVKKKIKWNSCAAEIKLIIQTEAKHIIIFRLLQRFSCFPVMLNILYSRLFLR